MSNLERLWQALDELPTLAAVEAEWAALTGGDFNVIKPLLRPRKNLASSVPHPAGNRVYRVVEHGPGDWVGVCDESGETIRLSRNQLVVYTLDQHRLATQVARALGLNTATCVSEQKCGLFSLGSYRVRGHFVAVYLLFPGDPVDIKSVVTDLLLRDVAPFLLLVPTRRYVTGEVELWLRSCKSGILALSDAMMVQNGRWSIAEDAIQAVAPDLSSQDEPLSDRAQEVLVAMLQLKAFDSDSRQSTAAIAARAMGAEADANSLKPVMSELATRRLIQTRAGRGGGCWLTKAGKLRAERLNKF
ncbi:MAG: hypothetical protein KatS3mg109_0602 [Pirellulaceae bacterium]|nr:MAG: hypothetical protein KatS3mg109_0602 [Pirellulaceae bacterium]